MVSKLENIFWPWRVGPRGPTLGTCAWYRFTCTYCYNIFIFKVCSMTYDWWRVCNTMELGSNSSHTEFFLSNNHVQTASITKDLGAPFELKFKARINDIINSALQRSALIYRSFLSCDTYNLILAFKTHVRPLLKYVSPVWSPTHVMLIPSVEVVQLGFTKRLLSMDLFRILNVWISLDFNPWTATDFWTLTTDCVQW